MKVNKILSVLMSGIIFCASNITSLAQDDNITVYIDDNKIEFDVEPQIINERTMVPMRMIFEQFGASVTWDQNSQTVVASTDDKIITLTIGVSEMTVNASTVVLDVAPCIVNDRTLVPIRAISEALGAEVQWDGDTRTITIQRSSDETGRVAFEKLKNYIIENGEVDDDRTFTLIPISANSGLRLCYYVNGNIEIDIYEYPSGYIRGTHLYLDYSAIDGVKSTGDIGLTLTDDLHDNYFSVEGYFSKGTKKFVYTNSGMLFDGGLYDMDADLIASMLNNFNEAGKRASVILNNIVGVSLYDFGIVFD